MRTTLGVLPLTALATLFITVLGQDEPRTTAWIDFDGDGRSDLFTLEEGRVRLRANGGAAGFEDVTSELPDLDGCQAFLWSELDGRTGLELIAAGPSWLRVVRRQSGVFVAEELVRANEATIALEVGVEHLDGDDAPDIWIRTPLDYELFASEKAYLVERVVFGAAASPQTGVVSSDVADRSSAGDVSEAAAPLRGDALGRRARNLASSGSRSTVVVPPPSTSVSGAPAAQPLQPGCADSIVDQATGACLEASSIPQFGALYPMTAELNVNPLGKVGIGAQAIDHMLEIIDTSTSNSLSALLKLQSQSLSTDADARLRWVLRNGSGQDRQAEIVASKEDGDGVGLNFRTNDDGTVVSALRMRKNGLVGIGGIVPVDHLLEIVDTTSSNSLSALLKLQSQSVNSDGDARLRWVLRNGAGVDRQAEIVAAKEGNDGVALNFRTNNDGQVVNALRLRKDGRVEIGVLEILGGADVAEPFPAAEENLEPGMVVVLDGHVEGAVRACCGVYDRRVVGVISGAGGVNAGLVLSQEGFVEGDVRVAMIGQVDVRCSTENGPIRPGDLLTTSSSPGRAMRATDSALAFGAVIGKALGSLDESEGLVRVVVNLQ